MNDTTTIRVSKDIYDIVKSLAQQQNENIQDIIEHAVTEYKKKQFFEELNTAYARLKSDPQAWKEEQAEYSEWDRVLKDGVENTDEDQ